MPYVESTGPTPGLVPGVGVVTNYNVTTSDVLRGMRHYTLRWCRSFIGAKGISHLESRQYDAFCHCWLGCECARRFGILDIRFLEHLEFRPTRIEIARILGRGAPHNSLTQDVYNQGVGRRLAVESGTPSSLADRAFRGNRLTLTAPLTNEVFTLADGQTARPERF